MNNGGVGAPRNYERRGRSRVGLSVNVNLGRGAIGEAEGVAAAEGESVNLSTGGVYLTTDARGSFSPGDVMQISIEIPREARRLFPFSRIVGSCRVVRVDYLPAQDEDRKKVGLALEFSGQSTTLLGAIVA